MAANWKMYKTIQEAVDFIKILRPLVEKAEDRDVLICAPFTAIHAVATAARGSNIRIGGQNMHFEREGAFTGEISAAMLLDAGATWVVLGHSERRHVFHESDEMINKKVHTALANGLKPILCVGELIEEREAGRTESVVRRQVVEGFKGLSREQALKVAIAYEPVWAIGTGKTATPEDADGVHAFIRRLVAEQFDQGLADAKIIQYGGSVKPENVDALMAKPNIDGALVGGASLKPESFSKIVRFQPD
jgi:triosephosphate isomerase (TIM)